MTLGEYERMFADNCCQKTSNRPLMAAVQQAKQKQPVWVEIRSFKSKMMSITLKRLTFRHGLARLVTHLSWSH
jgi:hypothetical protein